MRLQQIDYYQLAKAMLAEKALTGPAANYAHGPGGVFSTPGLSQPVLNAMALPVGGLGARLPAQTTIEDTVLIGLITGVDDEEDGDEPDGVCDEPKSVGLARGCTISFPLGLISRKSPIINLTNYGKITNRGEFRDLRLIGGNVGGQAPFIPSSNESNTLEGKMFNGTWNIGLGFIRKLGRMTYTGNPVNSTPNGGYKEFKGLDILINTGYQDVQNPAVDCEAVDSVVVDFASANISADAVVTVKAIVSTYRNLQIRADLTGLSPVSWCISMRPEAFDELTAIWPCAYATSGCMINDSEGQRLMVSADAQIALRDDMRTQNYLLIDGKKVSVETDPYIPQTQPAPGTLTFESDIYFTPEFVLGRVRVAYWEFANYNTSGGVMAMASQLAPLGMYQASDGGRVLWLKKSPDNYCVQLQALMEPRLVLLTPHLAARIVNVQYSTDQLYRAAHPEDAGYLDGGGVSRR